ncbi:MAG: ABC transporter ATP-binding protein [Bacteroidota bacterium]
MKLQIRNLHTSFSDGTTGLQGINLTLGTGICSVLGPSGSGKSTLLQAVTQAHSIERGTIRLDGQAVHHSQRSIGYLSSTAESSDVTGEQFLLQAALQAGILSPRIGREQVHQLLHKFGLFDQRKKPLSQFSKGMLCRIFIARSLLGHPSVVLLDDPTALLSPLERQEVLRYIAEIGRQRIVLMATSNPADASALGGRLVIMDQGRIIASGKTDALEAGLNGRTYERLCLPNTIPYLEEKYSIIARIPFLGKELVTIVADEQPDASFSLKAPTLEDYYCYKLSKKRVSESEADFYQMPPLNLNRLSSK